jgi:hypothetical protein
MTLVSQPQSLHFSTKFSECACDNASCMSDAINSDNTEILWCSTGAYTYNADSGIVN